MSLTFRVALTHLLLLGLLASSPSALSQTHPAPPVAEPESEDDSSRSPSDSLPSDVRRDAYQVFLAVVNAIYADDVAAIHTANARGGLSGSLPACIWTWSAETEGGYGTIPGFDWSGDVRCLAGDETARSREARLRGLARIDYTPAARVRRMWISQALGVNAPGPLLTEELATSALQRFRHPLTLAVGHNLAFDSAHCMAEDYPGLSDWEGFFVPVDPVPPDATPPYWCRLGLDPRTGQFKWFLCSDAGSGAE